MTPLLHGENYFDPVSKAPKGKATKHESYIAGHSESGHHHVVKSKTEFEVIESDEAFFLRLFAPAEVEHKKSFEIHETKTLQPGTYKINHKQEYDSFEKVMREIFD